MSELYGIFIDGDNMNPQYFDVLHRLIQERGKIIMKRVYGDFTEPNLISWKKTCLESGIEGVIAWRDVNKNTSDIKMVMDILNILEHNKHINNFVIVTGDIDFKHICQKIVSENKNVIGVSCFEKSTSKNLKVYCSEFIILDNIENLKPHASQCGGNGDNLLSLSDFLSHIKDILTSEARSINLGLLKTKLLNRNPCFNETQYGFKIFKDLIKSFEPAILMRQDKLGNYLVELNELNIS
jgi:predicted nuclease of predicted toxin-antitoxin system